jgi:hypothetical protein
MRKINALEYFGINKINLYLQLNSPVNSKFIWFWEKILLKAGSVSLKKNPLVTLSLF